MKNKIPLWLVERHNLIWKKLAYKHPHIMKNMLINNSIPSVFEEAEELGGFKHDTLDSQYSGQEISAILEDIHRNVNFAISRYYEECKGAYLKNSEDCKSKRVFAEEK